MTLKASSFGKAAAVPCQRRRNVPRFRAQGSCGTSFTIETFHTRLNVRLQCFARQLRCLQSFRPSSAGMWHIPCGFSLIMPPLARIVIAESVNYTVPQRREYGDQQGFGQGNPDVFDDQKTAMKIRKLKVMRFINGVGVLRKTFRKRWSRLFPKPNLPLRAPGGTALPI